VFLWAPVAWALVGWALTGWRMTRPTQGDGRDCLYFASALSLVMVAGAIFVALVCPVVPAGQAGEFPLRSIMEMLSENANFLIFLVISLVVFGLMQFYFLGSAQFMQDQGIASKHVPGSMALAQAAQAIATYFLMIMLVEQLGYRWTLTIGATCWCLLYLAYIAGQPRWLLVAVQPLHGLAYVFFVIVGQIFVNTVAPETIRSSMQALIFAATTGVGLFLGTQFAGIVMDACSKDGKFVWRKVWLVPCVITLAGVLALILAFRDPTQQPQQQQEKAQLDCVVSVWADQA
jgi:Na+/melibiose symporter-like transporter